MTLSGNISMVISSRVANLELSYHRYKYIDGETWGLMRIKQTVPDTQLCESV